MSISLKLNKLLSQVCPPPPKTLASRTILRKLTTPLKFNIDTPNSHIWNGKNIYIYMHIYHAQTHPLQTIIWGIHVNFPRCKPFFPTSLELYPMPLKVRPTPGASQKANVPCPRYLVASEFMQPGRRAEIMGIKAFVKWISYLYHPLSFEHGLFRPTFFLGGGGGNLVGALGVGTHWWRVRCGEVVRCLMSLQDAR